MEERSDLPNYESTTSTAIKPQHRRLHDSDVKFEEYMWYAEKTRALELADNGPPVAEGKPSVWQLITRKKTKKDAHDVQIPPEVRNEKTRSDSELSPDSSALSQTPVAAATNVNLSKASNRMEITDEEWTNASRMLRTATWGACFYLITTDILGPYGVGFALGTLGWGPGQSNISLFIVC